MFIGEPRRSLPLDNTWLFYINGTLFTLNNFEPDVLLESEPREQFTIYEPF